MTPASIASRSCFVSAAIALLLSSCGGGQAECHTTPWTGTCQLVQVTKIRESEFPLPNVLLEGIYRPQPAAGATIVPADARQEFGALSKFEDALQAHLRAHPTVRCYVNPPPPGQCQPGPMVVEVPEFDPAHAEAATADVGPQGCAQIEASSSQDRITQNKSASVTIEQRFEFTENSAELASSAAGADLDALAARLKQDRGLSCVGVVGAWVRGETIAVAFARARAVREELIKRGVGPERLLALTVDPPMVGSSGIPEPVNPKDRRVSISVLLNFSQNP